MAGGLYNDEETLPAARKPMSGALMHLNLPDSSATETLGRLLAACLPDISIAGAVLYLHGDLGAGKTTSARSLLHALGVVGAVRSPTYTLVDTYSLPKLTCVHVDLYRVQSLVEVDELGLRDMMGPGCLLLIEWPEKGAAAVPQPDLTLSLEYAGAARRAVLAASSALGGEWLSKLVHDSRFTAYVSNLT
jgi:tRNA threonylcarbamoyladenosine biosynthesis protein TsaE